MATLQIHISLNINVDKPLYKIVKTLTFAGPSDSGSTLIFHKQHTRANMPETA